MKKFLELHRWFYRESKKYLNGYSLKNILYFPIAYVKFMYRSLLDAK